MPKPLRLFYSYSAQDERWREELETHLRLLTRQGLIDDWHAGRIEAGSEWAPQLAAELQRADIILLLVSANFLSSDHCYGTELMRALARHAEKSAHVVPVLLRSVDLTGAPFDGLTLLPENAKPVSEWLHRDQAWTNVAQGIRRIVEHLMHHVDGTVKEALALAERSPAHEAQEAQSNSMSTHITGKIIGSLVITGDSNRVSIGRLPTSRNKGR